MPGSTSEGGGEQASPTAKGASTATSSAAAVNGIFVRQVAVAGIFQPSSKKANDKPPALPEKRRLSAHVGDLTFVTADDFERRRQSWDARQLSTPFGQSFLRRTSNEVTKQTIKEDESSAVAVSSIKSLPSNNSVQADTPDPTSSTSSIVVDSCVNAVSSNSGKQLVSDSLKTIAAQTTSISRRSDLSDTTSSTSATVVSKAVSVVRSTESLTTVTKPTSAKLINSNRVSTGEKLTEKYESSLSQVSTSINKNNICAGQRSQTREINASNLPIREIDESFVNTEKGSEVCRNSCEDNTKSKKVYGLTKRETKFDKVQETVNTEIKNYSAENNETSLLAKTNAKVYGLVKPAGQNEIKIETVITSVEPNCKILPEIKSSDIKCDASSDISSSSDKPKVVPKIESPPKERRTIRRTSDVIAAKIQNIFSNVVSEKKPAVSLRKAKSPLDSAITPSTNSASSDLISIKQQERNTICISGISNKPFPQLDNKQAAGSEICDADHIVPPSTNLVKRKEPPLLNKADATTFENAKSVSKPIDLKRNEPGNKNIDVSANSSFDINFTRSKNNEQLKKLLISETSESEAHISNVNILIPANETKIVSISNKVNDKDQILTLKANNTEMVKTGTETGAISKRKGSGSLLQKVPVHSNQNSLKNPDNTTKQSPRTEVGNSCKVMPPLTNSASVGKKPLQGSNTKEVQQSTITTNVNEAIVHKREAEISKLATNSTRIGTCTQSVVTTFNGDRKSSNTTSRTTTSTSSSSTSTGSLVTKQFTNGNMETTEFTKVEITKISPNVVQGIVPTVNVTFRTKSPQNSKELKEENRKMVIVSNTETNPVVSSGEPKIAALDATIQTATQSFSHQSNIPKEGDNLKSGINGGAIPKTRPPIVQKPACKVTAKYKDLCTETVANKVDQKNDTSVHNIVNLQKEKVAKVELSTTSKATSVTSTATDHMSPTEETDTSFAKENHVQSATELLPSETTKLLPSQTTTASTDTDMNIVFSSAKITFNNSFLSQEHSGSRKFLEFKQNLTQKSNQSDTKQLSEINQNDTKKISELNQNGIEEVSRQKENGNKPSDFNQNDTNKISELRQNGIEEVSALKQNGTEPSEFNQNGNKKFSVFNKNIDQKPSELNQIEKPLQFRRSETLSPKPDIYRNPSTLFNGLQSSELNQTRTQKLSEFNQCGTQKVASALITSKPALNGNLSPVPNGVQVVDLDTWGRKFQHPLPEEQPPRVPLRRRTPRDPLLRSSMGPQIGSLHRMDHVSSRSPSRTSMTLPLRYSYTEMLSKVCSMGMMPTATTPAPTVHGGSTTFNFNRSCSSSSSQVSELWSDLSEEQSAATHATEMLDAETTERMRLEKEVHDLQSRYSHTKQRSDKMELEMMEARVYRSELNGDLSEDDVDGNSSIYRQKYERAVRDMEIMKRRIQQQQEDDMEQKQMMKKASDKKLAEALEDVEEERQVASQWKRKAQKLGSELQDLRMMLEEQMARNGELEKKQRRFDAELSAVQEELKKERVLREKLAREKDQAVHEKYSIEQDLQSARIDMDMQHEKITQLNKELDELTLSSKGEEEVTQLKRAKQELERKSRDQEEELEEFAAQVQMLEQAKLRLEMSLEKLRQEHRRESSVKEEEIEEIRASSSKKIKSLEAQLENEQDERHQLVKQKHELERRLYEMTDQPAPHDPEVERRLRRDLKRTKALLRDAQAMLEHARDGHGNKSIIRQLKNQLEDAEFAKAAAVKSRQAADSELQDLQVQLEEVTRVKNEFESRSLQLSRERSNVQTQLEEAEEEMAEVMKKYKAVVAQMSIDQKSMVEQTQQIADLESENKMLKEQLSEVSHKFEHLAGQSEDAHKVLRLDGKVRELESKLELEQTTRARLESQISRLKELNDRAREESDSLRNKELQAQEGVRRFQRQIRELREDYAALQQKEADGYRKQHDLEVALENADADLQVTKNDLRLACQRIQDLQNALEEDLDSGTDVPDDSGSDTDSSSYEMPMGMSQCMTPIQRCDSISSNLSYDLNDGGRHSRTSSFSRELSAFSSRNDAEKSVNGLPGLNGSGGNPPDVEQQDMV